MPIPNRNEVKQDLIAILTINGPLKTAIVYQKLAEYWQLNTTEKQKLRSDRPLFQHEIRWARQELVAQNVIDTTKTAGRGIWQLSNTELRPIIAKADEITTTEKYLEGAATTVLVNSYERNNRARTACLSHFGYKCQICTFDFQASYGAIGQEAIHVHHLVPLSEIDKEYEIDPIKDLLPVCPNCHYIIHRRAPPFAPHEVRAMLKAINRESQT